MIHYPNDKSQYSKHPQPRCTHQLLLKKPFSLPFSFIKYFSEPLFRKVALIVKIKKCESPLIYKEGDYVSGGGYWL